MHNKMAELPLNVPAGVLVKTTLVDFPGIVAGSFFLKGCNLRCPYCYNIGLVMNNEPAENLDTVEDLISHLEKRQGILSGLVISGGEPLLNPYTPLIIKKAKELGYLIKLDTNGLMPDKLQTFIEDETLRPDFIAMDLKTTPAKYAEKMCTKEFIYYGQKEYFETTLKRSAELISKFPADKREWRTVLVPGLVSKEDIPEMAAFLPSDASWQFAQFMNKNCLDKSYNDIAPYIDSEIQEIINTAKSYIENSQLR